MHTSSHPQFSFPQPRNLEGLFDRARALTPQLPAPLRATLAEIAIARGSSLGVDPEELSALEEYVEADAWANDATRREELLQAAGGLLGRTYLTPELHRLVEDLVAGHRDNPSPEPLEDIRQIALLVIRHRKSTIRGAAASAR